MPIRESPSGATSTTVEPFTVIDRSFGAVNVAPPAVVFGVSVVSVRGAEFAVAVGVGEAG